ncbi:MAG TPA: hypothetical protein DDY71_11125 [Spirochaetia bacterium]|nr:hypothetical protein [Spirochaetia bacterium]
MKNKLYLLVTIGPTGLNWTSLIFLNEKPNAYSYTRGEGQALVFELVDGDFSTNFKQALDDGLFIEEYGKRFYEIDIRKLKEDWDKSVNSTHDKS